MQVRVHVVTFNMAGILPDKGLPASLFACPNHEKPDMYVFGTQESCSLSDWEQLLDEHLGAGYVKIAQDNLMAISLVVYASEQLAPHIYNIQTSKVACGVGNVLGNKGGVAVSCTIAGTRIMLVTCHLAAHGEHVERRNTDYARIAAGLFKAGAVTNANAVAPEGPTDEAAHITPRLNPWMVPASLADARHGPLQSRSSSQQTQQHSLSQEHDGGQYGGTVNGTHHHYCTHSSGRNSQGLDGLDSVDISPRYRQHCHVSSPSVSSHPLPASDFTEVEEAPPLSSLD
ncbi:Endonuclease/exonuclease/phosphatase, partial [Dunaliella salina]